MVKMVRSFLMTILTILLMLMLSLVEPISFVPLPDTGYDKLTLPAKLQARGDATEHISLASQAAINKTSKRPKRPYLTTTPSSRDIRTSPNSPPSARQYYKGDPGISLDTDLDSMEGIVNLAAISPLTPEMLARNRSLSGGSSLELDRIYAGDRHRPSIAESLSRGSATQGLGIDSVVRRGSFAPYHGSPNDSPSSYRAGSPSSPSAPPLLSSHNSGAGPSFWSTNHSNSTPLRDQPISPHTTVPKLLPSAYPQRSDSAFGHSQPLSLNTSIENTSRALMSAAATKDGAAWTAPDSWAVKGDAGALEADSSEDEVESEEEDDGDLDGEGEEELETVPGTPTITGGEGSTGTGPGTFKRLGSSAVLLKNGRPGTSGSRLGSSAGRFGANSGRLGSTAGGRPGTSEGLVRITQKSVS